MDKPKHSITILYDADCYLCRNFQQYLKLKQTVDIIYKNIREDSDYISSLQQQGYNLDKGMIIDIDGNIFQGKHAIAQIEELLDAQKRYDGFLKFCMSNASIRTFGYPIALTIRKLLLWMRDFNFFHYIIAIFIFLISFFPAYFGYMSEWSRVGYSTSIGFALCCYIPVWKSYKWKGMLGLTLVGSFGYLIESIGVLTCYPYGCFHYSEQLGPKLLDIVPYMLFFTRPPLVYGVWDWTQKFRLSFIHKALLGGIILMGLDLVLDPIAVWMGLRSYPGGGLWFGVPLSNFLGRIISGSISIAMLELILGGIIPVHKKRLDYGLLLTMIFFVGYALWRGMLR